MDFSSFELPELIVLSKALSLVKFEAKEPEASALAGSPVLGALFKSAAETLWQKAAESYPTSSAISLLTNGWPSLAADTPRMAAIKFHITQVEGWHNLSETTQRKYIQKLIYPLQSTEPMIDVLVNFGNEQHTK
jgi:hypothetical protein